MSSRALKVRFAGVGSSVPERVVTNEELSEVLDTTDEWITSRTGIRERRYAEPGTGASVHGALAARKALEVAEVDPSDVDLIICATVSPDYVIPSTAALIQRELGCKQAGGFDLSGACCGYVYAVDTAARFVATGAARNALVVGSEVMTAVSDPEDRATRVLFGDAASAALLQPTQDGESSEILHTTMGVSGNDEVLVIPGGGSRHPASAQTVERRDHYIKMNGREVFRFAVGRFGDLLQDAIAACDLAPDDISLVIPHQVNERIINSAAARAGISTDRVVVNIDRFGNTAAASVGLALDEALREGRLSRGDLVLLVAFGAGLSWGSALLRW